MRPLIINHFHISGNYIAGDFIEIHDNPSASFYQRQPRSSERIGTLQKFVRRICVRPSTLLPARQMLVAG